MTTTRPLAIIALTLSLLAAGCAAPNQGSSSAATAGELTLSPNAHAALPVSFQGLNASAEDASLSVVEADGLEVEQVGRILAGDNGTLSSWVQVTAGEATGNHTVTVALEAGGESVQRTIGVQVAEPARTLTEQDVVQLNLTMRTLEGEIAFTTEQDVQVGPVPTSEGFQAPRSFGAVPVPLAQGQQLPGNLSEALVGSGVGHDLSVEIQDAFGPETLERNQPREETVQRTVEQRRVTEVPRQVAQQQGLINASSQEGDELELGRASLPYTIDHLNETQVRLVLDVQENETYTLHEPWPDSAEVTNVTNETVTLYVTPPVAEGEMFTWQDHWPNATEVANLTEDEIVLRHSPEVGTTFTQTTRRGQSAELTVANLTEDQIVVTQDNTHPLAGQTLVFEISIEGIRDAPQPTMGGGGQGSPR